MLSIHKSVWLDLAWSVKRSNHRSEPTLWYVINTQVSVAGSGLVCKEIKPQQWTHSDMLSIHKSVWLDLAWSVERSNHHSEPTLWYVINTQVSVAGSGLVGIEIKPPQWIHSLICYPRSSQWWQQVYQKLLHVPYYQHTMCIQKIPMYKNVAGFL